MNLKKKIMVLFASAIMLVSVSPLAMAATPEPAGNSAEAQVTMAPAANMAVQTSTSFENDKYLTKGGAAFWFIFTIVLNGALSFWIGNRFYRMGKKDNHVSAEIRALRKDIDEKFVKNIAGFAEQEIDINNLNESLAMDEDGIKPADKTAAVLSEMTSEEEERFRRWEEAQSKPKTERPRVKSAVKEDLEDSFDKTKKINRKNYQPKRDNDDDFDAEDGDDLGETREIKVRGEGVKAKAKEILSDIFPFKED